MERTVPITDMHHDEDPAKDILEKIGDISGFDLFGPKVLVAIYVRPQKTKGGIYLTDRVRDEDLYQGKVGYVLKVGPGAFDDSEWFGDVQIKVGDWVGFRASDGAALMVNGVNCRLLEDVRIYGKAAHPDLIF